jgi:hypothetical protein
MPRAARQTCRQGAVNKATAEARAAVEESGQTPLEYMVSVMRDPKADAMERLDRLKELFPALVGVLAHVQEIESGSAAERA